MVGITEPRRSAIRHRPASSEWGDQDLCLADDESSIRDGSSRGGTGLFRKSRAGSQRNPSPTSVFKIDLLKGGILGNLRKTVRRSSSNNQEYMTSHHRSKTEASLYGPDNSRQSSAVIPISQSSTSNPNKRASTGNLNNRAAQTQSRSSTKMTQHREAHQDQETVSRIREKPRKQSDSNKKGTKERPHTTHVSGTAVTFRYSEITRSQTGMGLRAPSSKTADHSRPPRTMESQFAVRTAPTPAELRDSVKKQHRETQSRLNQHLDIGQRQSTLIGVDTSKIKCAMKHPVNFPKLILERVETNLDLHRKMQEAKDKYEPKPVQIPATEELRPATRKSGRTKTPNARVVFQEEMTGIQKAIKSYIVSNQRKYAYDAHESVQKATEQQATETRPGTQASGVAPSVVPTVRSEPPMRLRKNRKNVTWSAPTTTGHHPAKPMTPFSAVSDHPAKPMTPVSVVSDHQDMDRDRHDPDRTIVSEGDVMEQFKDVTPEADERLDVLWSRGHRERQINFTPKRQRIKDVHPATTGRAANASREQPKQVPVYRVLPETLHKYTMPVQRAAILDRELRQRKDDDVDSDGMMGSFTYLLSMPTEATLTSYTKD